VNLLESTAVDLGATGDDNSFGYGRVDAAKAVAAANSTVTADTQAPAVAISSPTSGSVSGLVAVNVSASDNVGVTRVELLVNGAVLASDTTAPYGFSWDASALAGSSVNLVARAYDAAGNVGTSKAVALTVAGVTAPDTTPPTVSIAQPAATSTPVSGTVTVTVNASDNVGVTRVEFLVNGSVVATDTASPYTFSWNTSALAGTSPVISARAYDAAGNVATSAGVTVSVASGTTATADTTPPVVTITGASDGAKVNGNVNLAASATDNVAVSSLTLSIDGSVVASSNTGSVSYKWNARKAPSGSHTITATARDRSGNQATKSIKVSN
jgi:hypothetical protein